MNTCTEAHSITTHKCMHAHIHTPSLSRVHTHTHKCTRTHAHTHVRARAHAYTQSHTQTRKQTHVHTHTHTHTHTHKHTHTCDSPLADPQLDVFALKPPTPALPHTAIILFTGASVVATRRVEANVEAAAAYISSSFAHTGRKFPRVRLQPSAVFALF